MRTMQKIIMLKRIRDTIEYKTRRIIYPCMALPYLAMLATLVIVATWNAETAVLAPQTIRRNTFLPSRVQALLDASIKTSRVVS